MSRVFPGANRFVEADRRGDLFLEFGVIENVVVRERLFDHHQIKLVQGFEQSNVGQCVGRIRVSH